MALAKPFRLKKKKDIEELFSKGKSVRGSFFFIRYSKNQGSHSRFAISISARARATAVEKNRIKRRVSAALAPIMHKANGYDMIIIVTEPILKKGFAEIKSEIEKNINKIIVQG